MGWHSIDTQAALDLLDRQIPWEDSRTLEYYAKYANEPYFPPDISRSGHPHKNIHLLCQVHALTAQYLELVLIDCDWFRSSALDNLHLLGRVDCLKRIELLDANGSTVLRCSRLIYRFLQPQDVPQGLYFRHAASIASPPATT